MVFHGYINLAVNNIKKAFIYFSSLYTGGKSVSISFETKNLRIFKNCEKTFPKRTFYIEKCTFYLLLFSIPNVKLYYTQKYLN